MPCCPWHKQDVELGKYPYIIYSFQTDYSKILNLLINIKPLMVVNFNGGTTKGGNF